MVQLIFLINITIIIIIFDKLPESVDDVIVAAVVMLVTLLTLV